MKSVLVTGGCGFIGAHFIRLLVESGNYRVANLDKLTYAGSEARLAGVEDGESYSFFRGDIVDSGRVREILASVKPDVIVNFAAESHVDRSILDASPFIRTNVLGVQVLLDAAREYGIKRFVQVSTDEVYGDRYGLPPVDETGVLAPGSPYAASKASADLLCLANARTYGLPVVIVRSANNFGPWQYPEKLIPLVILNATTDKPIPVYGDGSQQRDWLFVDDNCAGLLRAMESGRDGEIYNLGTGELRPNLELIRSLCSTVARSRGLDDGALDGLAQPGPDRPGHDKAYSIRTEKARTNLGWTPSVTFEEGLERTVAWYLDHIDWLRDVTGEKFDDYSEALSRSLRDHSALGCH